MGHFSSINVYCLIKTETIIFHSLSLAKNPIHVHVKQNKKIITVHPSFNNVQTVFCNGEFTFHLAL